MGNRGPTPKNWPASIPYLSQPSYSPNLTPAQRQALKTQPVELITTTSITGNITGTLEIPTTLPRGPSPLVKILPISSPTHPAKGQAGLFAARNLSAGTLIVPYYGIVHSSSPAQGQCGHEKSDYDLWLDHENSIAVDAEMVGNEARFVNDYRGVRPRPNAQFRECWDARRRERCMAVFVLPAGKNAVAAGRKIGGRPGGSSSTTAGIAKGDEILVSYGKGFWGKRREEDEAKPDDVSLG